MWPIPPSLHPLIFIIVVAIGAYFAQRKSGWKGLLVVWLASSVLATGLYVTWYSLVSPLSPRETLINAALVARAFLMLSLIISGGVVWGVAIVVRPPTEPEHFPPMVPSQRANDPQALVSIPWRYQKLLDAYADARQKAVLRPSFRVYFPSYQRQSWRLTRQTWRAPHIIMRGFVAAEPVLAELDEMTTAQLSALEAYHQLNLKRMKRPPNRPINLRKLLGVLVALVTAILFPSKALSDLITAMEKRGMIPSIQWETLWASILQVLQWETLSASILAFATQPPNWIIIGLILGAVLGILVPHIATRSMQRCLEDFGDLLGLALTRRRQESTTAPAPTEAHPVVPGDHGAWERPGPLWRVIVSRDATVLAHPVVKRRHRAVNGRRRHHRPGHR